MAEIKTPTRIAGGIAVQFINSKLTPLFILFSLLLGAFAILRTPREEEPQIVVPMLDVFVEMPGASAAEVEQRASIPMERLLREVPGVEYVYSISRPGMSMLVVRFYVGTKEEDAIVKAYNKLYSNFDRIPQGVSQPIIKVRSIDDVPSSPLRCGVRTTTVTSCGRLRASWTTSSSKSMTSRRPRSSAGCRDR